MYIFGTDHKHVTGGIAKSIKSLTYGLSELGVDHRVIATHKDGSKIIKLILFLKAIIELLLAPRSEPIFFNIGGERSFQRKCYLIRIARLKGHKVAIQLHSPTIITSLENPNFVEKFEKTCATVDRVIVLTNWWKDQISEYTERYKIDVLPNSIVLTAPPLDTCQVVDKLNQKNILFMSRLVPGKGADLAILAFSMLKSSNINLLIAGDGPEKEKLLILVKKLNIENNVTFLNWVSEEEKEKIFKKTSVFLLPSKRDSFGMGYIEAMSYSTPCFGLKFQSIVDVFSDGRDGVLVDSDGVENEVAKSIADELDLLFNDVEKYKTFSRNSYKKVVDCYTTEIVSKKFYSLSQYIISNDKNN